MTAAWDRSMPGDDLTGRTRHRWHVEGWENHEWGMVASPSGSIAEAQKKQAGVLRRVPGLTTRIVRETTIHAVEPATTHEGEW